MRLLGIDYGRKKIGLAIADGSLAEPYKVVRVNSLNEAIEKIIKVAQTEQIEKVILGISEGEMANETGKFAKSLSEKLLIPIELQDETLTSSEAQSLSIASGMKRKKRKAMEDAYSAALILQAYIDVYVV